MAFNTQQTKRTQVVVVVTAMVFVVILAVVVLSGAFTPKASSTPTADAGSAQQTATQTQQSQQGSTAESSSDTSAESSATVTDANGNTLSTMDEVNATYGTAERNLQATYDADSSNPVALLNLANGYFDWGDAEQSMAKSDHERQHARDLFNKAIELYDQYLKDNPNSNSVIVDRAISIFYAGDHKKAIAVLEEFTASNDSFAQAWANLGMFYQTDGQTDKAKTAYQKAVDTATDSNVKTYAQQNLEALNESGSGN